ncbi:MAG: adenosylmethionine decarboxylase [Candidatus Njordarchaeota archaeon]
MLGKHIILELHGIKRELLDDRDLLENLLTEAAKKAGGRVLGSFFHEFNPHGVTGIVAIAESHLSVHTWPEFGYAAIDIFTCRGIDPQVAADVIIERLKPEKFFTISLSRGDPYTEKLDT